MSLSSFMSFVKTFLTTCRPTRSCVTTASIHVHGYQQVPKKCQTRLFLSPPHCSLHFANCHLSTMAEKSSSDLVVGHDVENKMFFINLAGGVEKAVLEYEVIGPDSVNLYHTGVPVSHRGKGIAKVIAKAALDHFVSRGTNMKLTCTYLQKYLRDNPSPEYKDRIPDL